MNLLYNNPIYKDRRRELRKSQTPAERVLWAHIRNEKLDGHHFWRQYSVGPYILDFYSPAIRLCIELDGKHHAESETKAYDQERELYLRGNNITTLRFWNEEVVTDVVSVVEKIKQSISALPLTQ